MTLKKGTILTIKFKTFRCRTIQPQQIFSCRNKIKFIRNKTNHSLMINALGTKRLFFKFTIELKKKSFKMRTYRNSRIKSKIMNLKIKQKSF